MSRITNLGSLGKVCMISLIAAASQGQALAGQPDDRAIEEIVVTAQKRIERLIDTPQSVTVLSGEALAKLGATQLRDFADTVPGLTFNTSGAGYTQIALRGVTIGTDISPTVGIYVDEVPYGSSTGFGIGSQLALDVGLFDVDRIEVLRGPQGTLYGASTMGGLLKYVTRTPTADSFGVEVQAGLSSTEGGDLNYNVAAAVNAPIVADKLAVRASAFESRDGGYIDNLALGQKDINRSDVYGARVDLLYRPSDALTIRIGGFLQRISRDGIPTADYSLAGAPVDSGLDQRRFLAEPFDQTFRLGSATLSYDFGPATLTSISSYQAIETSWTFDFSTTFVPVLASIGFPYSAIGVAQHPETKKFTQELRVASNAGHALEWLIGGFYTDEDTPFSQEFVLRDLAGRPAPNIFFTYSGPSTYEEYAAFANLTYHLTEAFDVSGGLRYSRNEQEFTQIGSGLLIGSQPTTRSSENVATYLVNARYRFNSRATGYLRYATGYRPGGPNFTVNDPVTGLPIPAPAFEADRLRSYEAGFKAETADRRLGLDVAAFYIDWSNIQILTSRNGFSVYANADGGADIRGAELTLSARPFADFTVTGAFAYQDAQLSEDDPDIGGREGERLPNVPRFTAALSADYEFPGAWRPAVGATLRYVSERSSGFDAANAAAYDLPDYVTVDLRTGLAFRSVDLQLYARNLLDERAQLTSPLGGSPSGPRAISILQPRTIGVSVTTRF